MTTFTAEKIEWRTGGSSVAANSFRECLRPARLAINHQVALKPFQIAGGLKPQVQQYPKSIKGVLYAKELLSSKRSGARPDSGSS